MENGRKVPAAMAVALESAQMLMSPELAAELEQLRVRVDEVERKYTFDTAELRRQLETARVDGQRLIRAEQRRAELEAVLETHRKDDQAEIERLRKRVAELEAERHSTNDGLAAVTVALREAESAPARAGLGAWLYEQFVPHANAGSWDGLSTADQAYWEQRARVVERAAARGAFKAASPSAEESADKLTRLLAPSQALREDPHDSPLHHSYKLGRDLPQMGGAS